MPRRASGGWPLRPPEAGEALREFGERLAGFVPRPSCRCRGLVRWSDPERFLLGQEEHSSAHRSTAPGGGNQEQGDGSEEHPGPQRGARACRATSSGPAMLSMSAPVQDPPERRGVGRAEDHRQHVERPAASARPTGPSPRIRSNPLGRAIGRDVRATCPRRRDVTRTMPPCPRAAIAEPKW